MIDHIIHLANGCGTKSITVQLAPLYGHIITDSLLCPWGEKGLCSSEFNPGHPVNTDTLYGPLSVRSNGWYGVAGWIGGASHRPMQQKAGEPELLCHLSAGVKLCSPNQIRKSENNSLMITAIGVFKGGFHLATSNATIFRCWTIYSNRDDHYVNTKPATSDQWPKICCVQNGPLSFLRRCHGPSTNQKQGKIGASGNL